MRGQGLRLVLGLSLVASFLLAGCAGGSTSSRTTASTPTAGTSDASADTGAIEGQVVNDELVPVEGATIGLLDGRDLHTKSDADGRFVLNDLAPGTHGLVVQKLGYEHANVRVSVVAGEVAEVQVVLKPEAIAVEREVTYLYDGYIGFDFALPPGNQYGASGTIGIEGPTRSSVYYAVEHANLIGVVAGIRWAPTVPTTAERMELLIMLNVKPPTNCGAAASEACIPVSVQEGPSPLVNGTNDLQQQLQKREGLRINVRFKVRPCTTSPFTSAPEWATACTNPAKLVEVAIEQRVKLYTTMFYGYPSPEGYSPIPP